MLEINSLRAGAESSIKYGHGMPIKPTTMLELLDEREKLISLLAAVRAYEHFPIQQGRMFIAMKECRGIDE